MPCYPRTINKRASTRNSDYKTISRVGRLQGPSDSLPLVHPPNPPSQVQVCSGSRRHLQQQGRLSVGSATQVQPANQLRQVSGHSDSQRITRPIRRGAGCLAVEVHLANQTNSSSNRRRTLVLVRLGSRKTSNRMPLVVAYLAAEVHLVPTTKQSLRLVRLVYQDHVGTMELINI